jgi:hypothetical protein
VLGPELCRAALKKGRPKSIALGRDSTHRDREAQNWRWRKGCLGFEQRCQPELPVAEAFVPRHNTAGGRQPSCTFSPSSGVKATFASAPAMTFRSRRWTTFAKRRSSMKRSQGTPKALVEVLAVKPERGHLPGFCRPLHATRRDSTLRATAAAVSRCAWTSPLGSGCTCSIA